MNTSFIKPLAAITLCFSLFSIQQPVFAQDTTMHWENQPKIYHTDAPILTMRINSENHLWGNTYKVSMPNLILSMDEEKKLWGERHAYGFDFPYSQFYYCNVSGNFTAQATAILTGLKNYNNEGLMVKITPTRWIKLYVGKEDDFFRLNVVYASDESHTDFSTVHIYGTDDKVWLRILCIDGLLYLNYSTDGRTYDVVRILNMPENYKSARVGIMGESPIAVGGDAMFESFRVERK